MGGQLRNNAYLRNNINREVVISYLLSFGYSLNLTQHVTSENCPPTIYDRNDSHILYIR